ncbi:MAG TPA: diphosphomevalonate decarboxylase [Anaerolineae bacterium]|nr:diphosphomevalonate decarboxylase [Anaerolineae bacterium]
MQFGKATAQAHPNIAFIKYWGNRDHALRIPANSSLSMNMAGLSTTTTVAFDAALGGDVVVLGEVERSGAPKERVVKILDRVRARAGFDLRARMHSRNNFPSGAGLASSASGFAALAIASAAAAGLDLDEPALSRLARLGSGSACRSVPAGYVEWQAGSDDASSYAFSIAPPEHWDLRDVIAVVDVKHKAVGSTQGHALADTSPLHAGRVATIPDRLSRVKAAVLDRDFATLAPIVEDDALAMHAVMLTSQPPLIYWQPATVAIIHAVRAWRADGVPACFTIDAGANVHCLCEPAAATEVKRRLLAIAGVQDALTVTPGGAARLIETHLF